jgi:hypothetical protein
MKEKENRYLYLLNIIKYYIMRKIKIFIGKDVIME